MAAPFPHFPGIHTVPILCWACLRVFTPSPGSTPAARACSTAASDFVNGAIIFFGASAGMEGLLHLPPAMLTALLQSAEIQIVRRVLIPRTAPALRF